MKCLVELTEAEDKTLHQLSLNHHYRDTRIRAAGVLQLGRKVKLTEVSEMLGVSGQSVYNWAHAWRKNGLCGLLIGHKGGRPRALSDVMIATAVEAARAESMTLKQIAQRIEAAHGQSLPCRLDTLSAALKRTGFSYKRGRYTLKKNEIPRYLL
jgi:transposase